MNNTDNESVVRIEVCQECLRHACFVCGDEEISDEFFSQDQALAIAKDFHRDGDISHEVLDRLICEIRQSDLPGDISHGMEYLLGQDKMLSDFFHSATFPEFDEARVLTPLDRKESISDLHEFLDTFFPGNSGSPPVKRVGVWLQ